MKHLLTLTVVLALCSPAPAVDKPQIDAAVAAIAQFTHGQARQGVAQVETIVRETAGNADLRAYLEEKLAAALPAANDDAKLMICQQLWIIGPAKSLPAMEKMLQDDNQAHIACYGIGTAPSPAADDLLRKVAESAKGRAAINVLNQIGVRKDNGAVAALDHRAGDADLLVAEAALFALGRIGSPEAAGSLGKLRAAGNVAAMLPSLQCAEGLAKAGQKDQAMAIYREMFGIQGQPMIRRGAIVGAVRLGQIGLVIRLIRGNEPALAGAAINATRDLPGEDVTQQLAAALPAADPEIQPILIDALADRGGPIAREAIAQAANSTQPAVALAALQALGQAGDTSSADLLIKTLVSGSDDAKRTAQASLTTLPGGDATSTAIAKNLAGATAPVKAALIKTLADRRAATLASEFLKNAADADAAVARASLDALALLASPGDLPALLNLLTTLKDEAVRRSAELAVIAVALRNPEVEKRSDAVLSAYEAAAAPETKSSLLRVLGGIANPKAAETLKQAARDGDQGVKDSALRALSAWPDTQVTAFLLNYARLTDANNLRRALAVRGALRQMADAASALKGAAPSAPLVEWFVKAESLVRGPEEKRLLLSGLANLTHAESLRLVQNYLEDAEVLAEAHLAALQIADNTKDLNKESAKALATKVRDLTKDPATKQKAIQTLRRIGN